MNVEQVKRATGRTTRMLKDAAKHANQGHQLVVLAHSQAYARQLKQQLRGMTDVDVSVDNYNSYLVNPAVREVYRNHKLFIDHHAIERVHKEVLEDWIKYDDPTPRVDWVADGSCPKENGMYLITTQSSGHRSTQVTHWDTQNGWLAMQGKQWITAWAPLPKPFGEPS